MPVKCIIIEDEPLALERTKSYAEQVPALEILACFDNALEAIPFIHSQQPDLIFLDINLGNFSGIQLLETNIIRSQVIITTAYNEYAIKGFDLHVTDYLLKPFSFERFVQAVGRAQELMQSTKTSQQRDFIFIKSGHNLEKIFYADILFIEGMRDYRKIHTLHKQIMTLQNFTELEKELPAHLFCRIHKSYMIAISKIDSITKEGVYIGNILIPVSDTYRAGFMQLIQ